MKKIRDPIHRFLLVDDVILAIIDHRLVQRLRWVSQLPLEQLVYPSAQHSRFEHSLGTMHLAGVAAEALTKNSPTLFRKACDQDEYFRSLAEDTAKEHFILCARCCGLLHDIGHAPFSHTLEDACKYAGEHAYRYEHEKVGFHLSKITLEEVAFPEPCREIVLQVLNKDLGDEDLTPPLMILRRLIDSDLDVDKGDYVLRDAYHCGVTYGVYDPDLLWNHICLTENFDVAVDEKAALEAWTLSLARYKMHMYVYKHHIRNITDALLIEIISEVLSEDTTKSNQDVMPLQCLESIHTDGVLTKFVYWTDNSMLKALSETGGPNAKSKIEMFAKRKLYKRGFDISLKKFPNAFGNDQDVISIVKTIQKEYSEKGIYWNFMINKAPIPPVREKRVQQNIRVCDESGSPALAHYLGFPWKNGEDGEVEYPHADKKLYVFMDKDSIPQKNNVQERVEHVLMGDLGIASG